MRRMDARLMNATASRGQVSQILGETAASIEPCEGSLDNPPAWQDFETFAVSDRFTIVTESPGNAFASASRNWTLISAVSEHF